MHNSVWATVDCYRAYAVSQCPDRAQCQCEHNTSYRIADLFFTALSFVKIMQSENFITHSASWGRTLKVWNKPTEPLYLRQHSATPPPNDGNCDWSAVICLQSFREPSKGYISYRRNAVLFRGWSGQCQSLFKLPEKPDGIPRCIRSTCTTSDYRLKHKCDDLSNLFVALDEANICMPMHAAADLAHIPISENHPRWSWCFCNKLRFNHVNTTQRFGFHFHHESTER